MIGSPKSFFLRRKVLFNQPIVLTKKTFLNSIIVLIAILSSTIVLAQTETRRVTRVSVSDAEIIDVDLRDLPRVRQWKPGDPIVEVPILGSTLGSTYVSPMTIDPLLSQQRSATRSGTDSVFPSPQISFEGQGPLGSVPPDTVGAVGVNYYIQAINGGGTSWIVYNKFDGSIAAGPFSLDELGSGDCASGAGDPIVLYDQLAGRWLLTEFDNGIDTACVYVSQTSDPISGGWFAYSFDFSQDIDYPKYGIWPDGYYLTSNDGSTADNSIGIFDRVSMLAGATATSQELLVPDMDGFVLQVMMAGDVDGPEPPAGSPAYLMRQRDDEVHDPGSNDPSQDFIEYYEVDVDFDTPGNTTMTGPTMVPISEFDSELCGLGLTTCFTQPGGGNALHSFKEMIMNRLQYRNFGTHEVMVGAFVTDVDNTDHGGIRWFELRKTGATPWSLYQEGTLSLDADHRWVSGISMDGNGNIALAYNVTGPSLGTYPGIRYIGRKADAPLGTMPEGEYSVVEGSDLSTSGRWGDYAAMTLDPVDDLTFWFTGEYSPSGATFGTRIFSVQFCSTSLSPSTNLIAANNGDNRIDVSWDAVPGALNYNVYRALGSCSTPEYTLIAEGHVANSFSDTTVSGGSTYSYKVRAYDPVEGCLSDASNCSSDTATGVCMLPPAFVGAGEAVNPQDTNCALDLNWAAATTECGTGVVYNIYRSNTSGFVPDLSTLVASCLTTETWRDDNVEYGETYYYIVRAEDQTVNGSGPCGSGNEDGNLFEVSGSPSGPDVVSFEDDIESGTGNWTSSTGPLDTGTNPWAVTTTGTAGNGSSWFCQDEPNTKDQRIETASGISLTSGSLLVFSNKYDTESRYDGGVLEYSTDGGTTWFDILDGNGGSVPANSERFVQGGYNSVFSSGPLGGQAGWTGSSNGFIPTEVDLSDMAGQTVHLRWRFVCDTSVNADGWWIDNFVVYSESSCDSILCVDLLSGLPLWPARDILYIITNCLSLDP